MAKQKRPFFRVIEDPNATPTAADRPAAENASADRHDPTEDRSPDDRGQTHREFGSSPIDGTSVAGLAAPPQPAHGEAATVETPDRQDGQDNPQVSTAGADPAADAGADPGFDPGADPGFDPGADPGRERPVSDALADAPGSAPLAEDDPAGLVAGGRPLDAAPVDAPTVDEAATPGAGAAAEPAAAATDSTGPSLDPGPYEPQIETAQDTPAASTATAAWTAYRADTPQPEMTDASPANPFLQERDLGPESIAVILRNRREALGYRIEDAAGMLRIRLPYLQAIEAADWKALPGSTYAIGFVRAYAGFLGMEPEPVVARFKDEIAGISKRPALEFPTPEVESRVPSAAIFLVATLIAVVAYGAWYLSTRPPQGLIDSIPRLPDRFAELLGGDSPVGNDPVGSLTADPLATPGREQVAPPDPEPAVAADSSPPAPLADGEGDPEANPDGSPTEAAEDAPAEDATAPQPAADETAPDETASDETASAGDPPEPPPLPPEDTAVWSGPSITLEGTGMSWIQIRDSAGALVMTRVLQNGDRYDVPTEPGLVLDTGNAGGLRILVGGEPVPDVGGPGEVVRSIPLDPARLEAGTAVPGGDG